MGSRKRPRPSPRVESAPEVPKGEGAVQTSQPAELPGPDEHVEHGSSRIDSTASTSKPFLQEASSLKSTSSRAWYTTGSWPRVQKASPSTQVARETILADKPKNAPAHVGFLRFEPRKTDAEITPTSNSLQPSVHPSEIKEVRDPVPAEVSTGMHGVVLPEESANTKTNRLSNTNNICNANSVGAHRPIVNPGWLEWLGLTNSEQKAYSELPEPQPLFVDNENSSAIFSKQQVSPITASDQSKPGRVSSQKLQEDKAVLTPTSNSSWYTVWPGGMPSKKSTNMTPTVGHQTDISMAREPVIATPLTAESVKPLPGSTWAFWSKDSQRLGGRDIGTGELGELAVTGEASQSNPAPANAAILSDEKEDQGKNDKGKKSNKRARQSPDTVQEPTSKTFHSDSANKILTNQKTLSTPPDFINKASQSLGPTLTKPSPPNLLLPSFRSTYRLVENPSIIQQIARLLMHNHQSPANHVHLAREPSKIRKALAIGIHGLFPAPLLRTVIGQPTGTSIRFANHAAAAIHRWASSHDCNCEVEKVALEGEGKIAERVDNLWKLLLNWIDHVRSADLIVIACHSQGVPVAIMLVAKLIEFGVVTTARIGVCSMAGVSLGPFADYKSRLLSGSAAELFEFANQDSEVSKRYENSLRVALKYGVRVSFIGSIDDQLVSLESAVFAPVNHPYIYRAVFVDGRVHASDFIAHLVGFAMKLRNLGVSDHGLIRELSIPLAGSLYTGEGHSRLYDEDLIYDDAISFTLETTSVGDVPLQVQKFAISTNSNPFQLPWSLRGLLEEEIVKTELDRETSDLLKQFDEWKPTTKVLKDVKYRLEAIRSKL